MRRSVKLVLKAFKFVFFSALFVIQIGALSAQSSKGVHGQAMQAEPKYKEGFSHFDWADPLAQKGGVLRLGTQYAFDTLNPFSLKGTASGLLETLLFETLTIRSYDEPFAQYGLLAEKIFFSQDQLSITYQLRKAAKFSDGKPLTAADVAFSYKKLISIDAHPFYKSYFSDVKSVQVINKHRVRFNFKRKNPELHMILGELPILPKHIYSKGNFGSDYTQLALGSGPYTLARFDTGKIIEVKRNPNYWGAKLNVNVGKFNFDRIVFKVFRNETILFEGFKAHEFDFEYVSNSRQWAVDVKGSKWDKNWLIKDNLKHGRTQGMQGFVMNTRRPLFQNKAIRKALAIAFDFQWSNQTLFYGQYTQQKSYFDNSELGARGLPSKDELALLLPLKNKIPKEVFSEEPKGLGAGMTSRDRLRAAKKILDADGWKLNDGILVKNGLKFEFTILLVSKGFERIVEPYARNLKRLGIVANIKVVDSSIYTKKTKGYNYDMIVRSFGQSESPGNEQKNFWHSSLVDVEGGRNMMGVSDPAVDKLVETIVVAPSRKKLIAATRALDRVLWFSYYVVPNWFISSYRITYWNKFALPKKMPVYYSPQTYFMYFSWIDAKKEKTLKKAMKSNETIPR